MSYKTLEYYSQQQYVRQRSWPGSMDASAMAHDAVNFYSCV